MENQKNNKELKKRIAIIGAGTSGLTVAETLRQKGYANVVIFEKNNHVGGKCSTTEIDGETYELGAGIVAMNNKTVLRLVDRFNIKVERAVFGKSILVDGETGKILHNKNIWQKLVLLKQVFFNYRRIFTRYKNIESSGLANLDADLTLPFSVFAKKYKIELLSAELKAFFTGYGYGYFNNIPAIYVLKYLGLGAVKSFIMRKVYTFPKGIQNLWESVASKHDVRLDTVIKSIERRGVITITTNKKTEEFDKLIITSPLDEALNFLDATNKEKSLFSKITYIDYRTVACSVSGLKKASGYVPSNYSKSRIGFPVFWYYRHSNSNIYTFYLLADWVMTDNDAVKNIKDLINKMGGELERVHTVAHWKYFPHVSSKIMKEGYFDNLEAMQGENDTYYAGEIMNFSTVGLTSEYAEKLVERFL